MSRAVEYEVWRQINLIEDGEIVENETRKKTEQFFFYFLNCSSSDLQGFWSPCRPELKDETLMTI